MQFNNQEVTIKGKLIKVASLKDEWYDEVEKPESLIKELQVNNVNADIFTFWQKLPETEPKYNYPMEYIDLAAIPIETYDHWFEKQINAGARKAIRKASKRGVIVKIVEFKDELVRGITDIFNETPIRQGRPYGHYGKNFETVKHELSQDLERCDFIGAYYGNDLIGFIQLGNAGKCAIPFGMVAKNEHRDKSPQNALLAKAIEVCDRKRIHYLLYGTWSRGGLGDFKRHNGCVKIGVPRYYIPLRIKGNIALKLKLHHGIVGIIPEKVLDYLLSLRKKYLTQLRYLFAWCVYPFSLMFFVFQDFKDILEGYTT